MQYEYTMPQNIFEENGEVMCAGWAKKPYFNFNKELSKQNKHIKESVSYFLREKFRFIFPQKTQVLIFT